MDISLVVNTFLHATPHDMSGVIAGNEVITVKTPAFAESVTEGDVRWEKGKMHRSCVHNRRFTLIGPCSPCLCLF